MVTKSDCRYDIRTATAADLEWMYALEQSVFKADAWPKSAFRSEFSTSCPPRVAAGRDGGMGYLCLMTGYEELHITNLAVDPRWRRLGIGKQLVTAAIQEAARGRFQHIYLDVRVSNTPARKLYGGLGFVELYRRRGYYIRPTEDALVLARPVVAGDLA